MQNLEIDPNKEYLLAGDISASMNTEDPKCGGQTRFNYMLESFCSFIKQAQDFDQHGAPTVILWGNDVHVYEHVTLDKIESKLKSIGFEGFTNLHLLIDKAFQIHKEEKSELAREKKFHPGTILLVFTDGAPTNKAAVERSIAQVLNSIDTEEEFQIHLLTVGTIDGSLQQWLGNLHDVFEDKRINPRDFDIIHISKLEDTNFMSAVSANRHS